MIELFDTHCHLNDSEAFPNPGEAIREAHEAGVATLVVVGVDIESSRKAIEIAENQSGVFATVGRHPNYSANYDHSEIKELGQLLGHPKVVALGEIGLDYHWDFATKEQQLRCLRDQLALADDHKKPLVFHCREANKDLLELLAKEPKREYVLHCFSGDAADAAKATELGCWFGVDGPITYPKSTELREIIATIPRDKILIETDSPWLSPHPFRGKPNRPALLPLVNSRLAEALGMTEAQCGMMTTANAKRCFMLQ